MGDTEYFELCETASTIQCPDCALYWEASIMYCTCGTCMQPLERNRQLSMARYDVMSNTCYVIKKRILPTEPDMEHLCDIACSHSARNAEESPKAQKMVVTGTFWTDGLMMTNTASLCQILGGRRKRSFNTMISHRKTVLTWLRGKKEVEERSHGTFL